MATCSCTNSRQPTSPTCAGFPCSRWSGSTPSSAWPTFTCCPRRKTPQTWSCPPSAPACLPAADPSSPRRSQAHRSPGSSRRRDSSSSPAVSPPSLPPSTASETTNLYDGASAALHAGTPSTSWSGNAFSADSMTSITMSQYLCQRVRWVSPGLTGEKKDLAPVPCWFGRRRPPIRRAHLRAHPHRPLRRADPGLQPLRLHPVQPALHPRNCGWTPPQGPAAPKLTVAKSKT